ncbi:MAG TPA: hypothetical protein VGP31_15405, partial [Planosporangium sp.]|nr:hypothetical protein [Planosporangium sp.]
RRRAWAISGMPSSISQVLWVWRRSWKCMPARMGGTPASGSPVTAGVQARRLKLERRWESLQPASPEQGRPAEVA